MRFRFGKAITIFVIGAALVSGCSSGSTSSQSTTAATKVNLSFWSWVPNIDKVVDLWNNTHPNIHVTVNKDAQGDALYTKLLTAAKAGNPPDLAQIEYQALPTMVSNNVVADIKTQATKVKSAFSDGLWQQVTLGTNSVYAIPQDAGPMMLFYRSDLFAKYGLQVPTTWADFATLAQQVRVKDPKAHLTTFSANDPGWFAGLAQQAGASWWAINGNTWKVSVNDAASQSVANYWGGLVDSGAIDKQPMFTPAWYKALNDGSLLAWPSGVWAPGVLSGNAASTKGDWQMAPLPQWSAGQNITGNWGGSTTAVMAKSKNQAAATQFAIWLNTDPTATAALVTQGGLYPADADAQTGPALQQPPAFFSQQTNFYPQAKAIAATAAGFTWGPDVTVTYSAYTDDFGKAITQKSPFGAALDQMQATTVADMQNSGFTLAN